MVGPFLVPETPFHNFVLFSRPRPRFYPLKTAKVMSASMRDNTNQITLPDLVSHCTFPLRLNPFCEPVASKSEAWMIDGANFSDQRCRKFRGLKAGLLTAMCYPDCGEEGLRVVSDFMNYLFNLDDWTEEFDALSTRRIAGRVMDVLYHTETNTTESIPGKMAKRRVAFRASLIHLIFLTARAVSGNGSFARPVRVVSNVFWKPSTCSFKL